LRSSSGRYAGAYSVRITLRTYPHLGSFSPACSRLCRGGHLGAPAFWFRRAAASTTSGRACLTPFSFPGRTTPAANIRFWRTVLRCRPFGTTYPPHSTPPRAYHLTLPCFIIQLSKALLAFLLRTRVHDGGPSAACATPRPMYDGRNIAMVAAAVSCYQPLLSPCGLDDAKHLPRRGTADVDHYPQYGYSGWDGSGHSLAHLFPPFPCAHRILAFTVAHPPPCPTTCLRTQ